MITLPWERGMRFARGVAEALAPFCSRPPMIVGSLRRRRPEAHDVDLLVVSGEWQALRKRALERAHEICCGEEVFRLETTTGIQVDIYRAHERSQDLGGEVPSNYGTMAVCKTGSKEFNVWMAQRAQRFGLHWNPSKGLFRDGTWVAGETEEELFAALEVEFMPPEQRR